MRKQERLLFLTCSTTSASGLPASVRSRLPHMYCFCVFICRKRTAIKLGGKEERLKLFLLLEKWNSSAGPGLWVICNRRVCVNTRSVAQK